MIRKKTMALLLATSMAVTAFAGCSNETTDETVETTQAETEAPVQTEEVVETEAPTPTEVVYKDIPVYVEENVYPSFTVDTYESDILQFKKLNYYYHGDSSSVSYEALALTPNYKELYPELDKALTAYDESMREELGKIACEENGYADSNISIRRAQGGVLSFIAEDINDMYSDHIGYNYDIETGKQLTAEDVFVDPDAIAESLGGGIFYFIIDAQGVFAWDERDTTYSFIPFGDTMLKGDFSDVSSENGFVIDLGTIGTYIDVDGDGDFEEINAYINAFSDDGEVAGLRIAYDGNNYIFEDVWGYGVEASLVYNGDIYFLYVTQHQDNDFTAVSLYELDPIAVISVGVFNGGIGPNYVEGDMVSNYIDGYVPFDGWFVADEGAFTDPLHFYLQTRVDMAGTFTVSYLCQATGESGFPESVNNVWCLVSPRMLRAKTDINAVDYNDDTDVVIEAGSEVAIMAVIGDVLIVENNDGQFLCLVIEHNEDDWGQYIDGVYVDELFEGVVYAG